MKKGFFTWMLKHLQNKPDSVVLICDLGYPDANKLFEAFPDRALNVGVCEQNAALVAKGLCSEGFEVFIYGISAFSLWRAAEALRIYFNNEDRLRLVGNGGGFGYGVMGSSHHSIDDLGLVSLWGAWNSWMPRRDMELPSLLSTVSALPGPHYLRLTNNDIPSSENFKELGVLGEGSEITVVTYGPLADVVAEAVHDNKKVQVFTVHRWPLDLSSIQAHFEKSGKIHFFEEHQAEGGLSQKIAATLNGDRKHIHLHCVSPVINNGSRNYLLATQGFDSHNIRRTISSDSSALP